MKFTLSTERLQLLPITENHIPALLNIYNNEATMKLIPNSKKFWTAEDLLHKYQCLKQKDGYGIFAISLKENNQIIGEAGLFDSFNDPYKVELGYIIDEPFWEKGYGTEICTFLINHCLSAGFKSIIARMYSNNTASVKLSEKCGLIKVSTFRDKQGRQAYEYRLETSI